MLLALLLLCVVLSVATLDRQHPVGSEAGRQVAAEIAREFAPGSNILVVTPQNPDAAAFSFAVRSDLARAGFQVLDAECVTPSDTRRALVEADSASTRIDAMACTDVSAKWPVVDSAGRSFKNIGQPIAVSPASYAWPNFLKTDNLLNVANQIAVIAIVAIGMTMVIITAGIDLSVGSLIALSAVVTSLTIYKSGAEQASTGAMLVGCIAGIATCATVGLFTGIMITKFQIPPFIVTLSMMLVASGLAYIISDGQSIYQLPDAFVWLGRGADIFSIPNAVVLMLVLYATVHTIMTRTPLGRHIYAVGGNSEAARLSGVPVARVLLAVYVICGALAGLGGVVMASQLKSGAPTYGVMYELYVIAAVVVGGTSLAGGEGKILGTLIGAFIIAVIQNGMNLLNVESYTQKVVLGFVILAAVLLDTIKRRSWNG
jgi:ribose transport system permease protein